MKLSAHNIHSGAQNKEHKTKLIMTMTYISSTSIINDHCLRLHSVSSKWHSLLNVLIYYDCLGCCKSNSATTKYEWWIMIYIDMTITALVHKKHNNWLLTLLCILLRYGLCPRFKVSSLTASASARFWNAAHNFQSSVIKKLHKQIITLNSAFALRWFWNLLNI